MNKVSSIITSEQSELVINQDSPEPPQTTRVANPDFVTPNDKTPGDLKSDLGSDITYGDRREKNDEEMKHEEELANRWNI